MFIFANNLKNKPKYYRYMRVLLINGSPKDHGNTSIALTEVANTLNEEGIETVMVSIGKQAVQGCIACGWCGRNGKLFLRAKSGV